MMNVYYFGFYFKFFLICLYYLISFFIYSIYKMILLFFNSLFTHVACHAGVD